MLATGPGLGAKSTGSCQPWRVGAPQGAAGHRAGTDGSTGAGRGYQSRGAKQDSPAQLHSSFLLPAAGLSLAGSGELAGAQHRCWTREVLLEKALSLMPQL